MEIRNVTQFSSYVNQHGLASLDFTFKKIGDCISDYLRHCTCHRKADKERIYNKCNSLYVGAANLAAVRFKNQFLNKTSERQIVFYQEDGRLIAIATR